MTNGAGKHHDDGEKKKAEAKTPKPKEVTSASLKKKKMLPKGLEAKKGE